MLYNIVVSCIKSTRTQNYVSLDTAHTRGRVRHMHCVGYEIYTYLLHCTQLLQVYTVLLSENLLLRHLNYLFLVHRVCWNKLTQYPVVCKYGKYGFYSCLVIQQLDSYTMGLMQHSLKNNLIFFVQEISLFLIVFFPLVI